ncbi:MAG: hypothetical protein ACAH88_05160 [Roseimicrobium sp.]
MPGPHIDQFVQDLSAMLNYTPLTSEQLKTATKDEIALDNTSKANSMGGEVFKEVETSGLTPQEKQEVHQRLGKAAMQKELTDANNQPTTFLRLASPRTNYMTAYLKEYAKDYNNAVLESAKQELGRITIPKDSGLTEKFPVIGAPQDQYSKEKPKTLQGLTDITEQVAGRLVQAHDDNLHKLSPEAQEFLKATMEPVQQQNSKELTAKAMSSTLMLKNTAPLIGEYTQSLGASQQNTVGLTDTQMKGSVILQASKAMQTYVNNVHKDPGTSLKQSGKAQDVMAEKLLTAENLDRTNNAYKAVADGDLAGLTMKKEMDAKLQPFNEQIKALGDKKAQLESNPGIGDKIKCFFKHGLKGVDGENEKLGQKIEATKVAKNDVEAGVTMEQRQQDLDRMKHNQAALGQVLQQAEGVVTRAGLAESGLVAGEGVSKEAVKEARSEGASVKELQKVLGAQIKEQEKVMSVREKLGPRAPQKTQGQSNSLGV